MRSWAWIKSHVKSLLACALLFSFFTIISWFGIAGRYATIDEPACLVGGAVVDHMGDFRVDPENPPLWKYWFGLGMPMEHFQLQTSGVIWDQMLTTANAQWPFYMKTLFGTPGNGPDEALTWARKMMLLLGLLLGCGICAWAWRIGGAVAAVVSAAAFSLDANLIAHSPLIKNDIATGAAFFALAVALWLLAERITLTRWLIMSLIFGAALVIKFTGVLAFPAMVLTLAFRALDPNPWPIFGRSISSRFGRFTIAAMIVFSASIVVWAFIGACYGFRFQVSAKPDEKFDEQMVFKVCAIQETLLTHGGPDPATVTHEQLDGWLANWQPSLIDRIGRWALNHRILPEAWLSGFLLVNADTLVKVSFLCGQVSQTGFRLYFPLAILFKTPTATLCAVVLASVAWLAMLRKSHQTGIKTNYYSIGTLIAVPAILFAAAISSHYDIGIRHAFPIYPFVILFLGVSAARAWKARPRLTRRVVWVLGILLAGETILAYPNFISFFNFGANALGGGIKLLSDSNLDWGQDVSLLKKWEEENPNRPVRLLVFTSIDTKFYGLTDTGSDPIRPGQVYAVSALMLQEVSPYDPRWPAIELCRNLKPFAVLGGSIYLFEVR